MLGTVATATIIVVEVGITVWNLNRQGAFDSLKDKFKKKRDYIKQEELKCLPQF